MKKLIALLACLTLALLAGCAGAPETPEASEPPEGTSAEAALSDGRGFSYDDVLCTIDGEEVFWDELLYYLKYIISYYEDSEGLIDWTREVDGLPLDEYCKAYALNAARSNRALEREAERLGLGATEAELAEIDAQIGKEREEHGEEEFEKMLSQGCNTERVYRFLLKSALLSERLFKELCGENGEKITDEQLVSHAGEAGYAALKFIACTDNNEAKAALEKLRGGADFNDLISEYSRLPYDVKAYPNGIVDTRSNLGEDICEAWDKLAPGESSGVVKSDKYSYIVLRLPFDGDMDIGGYTLRFCFAREIFDAQMSALGEALACETAPAFQAFELDE